MDVYEIEKTEKMKKFFRKRYLKYYLNLAKINMDCRVLTSFYEKGQNFHERASNLQEHNFNVIETTDVDLSQENPVSTDLKNTDWEYEFPIENCQNYSLQKYLARLKESILEKFKLNFLILDFLSCLLNCIKTNICIKNIEIMLVNVSLDNVSNFLMNFRSKNVFLIFFMTIFLSVKFNLIFERFKDNYWYILINHLRLKLNFPFFHQDVHQQMKKYDHT